MPHYTKFFEQGAADLRRILKQSLLVRDVAVELRSCVPSDSADSVRLEMKNDKFDIKGFKEGDKVVGYIRREDLKHGFCDAYQRKLEPCDTLGDSEPILTMVSRLKNRRWLFVVAKDTVNQIVTLADLQKAPVRMALFGLMSLLEMYLASMIRSCYASDAQIERLLEQKRLWSEAKKTYDNMKRRREQTDLVSSLMLPAKYHLVCSIASAPDFFAFRNREQATELFRQAVNLRNNLVHGHDLVEGTSWGKAIDVVENIRQVLDLYETKRKEFERRFGSVRQKT